jgi:hypothetical protein
MVAAFVNDPWVVRRLPAMVETAGLEGAGLTSHGFAQVADADFMVSTADRGADAPVANGRIGRDLADALKTEARRRVEEGSFFGHIAYAGKPAWALPPRRAPRRPGSRTSALEVDGPQHLLERLVLGGGVRALDVAEPGQHDPIAKVDDGEARRHGRFYPKAVLSGQTGRRASERTVDAVVGRDRGQRRRVAVNGLQSEAGRPPARRPMLADPRGRP